LAKSFLRFSTNTKNPFADKLSRIAAMEGVVDCALIDPGGKVLHRACCSVGSEQEFSDSLEDINGLITIAGMYLGENEQCENIHLYCTNGEIVMWDLGALHFIVTGHGISNPAELRVRVNILKNDIITNSRLRKYCRSLPKQTAPFQPGEEEQTLFSALSGGVTDDEQS